MVPHTSVIIKDGKIEDIISHDKLRTMEFPKDTTMIYVNGAYIAPEFINTHIQGIHGFDTSDASSESILEMSKALVDYGVTAFCPTLYPQEHDKFISCISAINETMGQEEDAKIF